MQRPIVFVTFVGGAAILALWVLFQTPVSLSAVFSNPFQRLWGTQQHLNSTLLDASENAEPVRAAGRRLLQPLGVVRLVRVYDLTDNRSAQKH